MPRPAKPVKTQKNSGRLLGTTLGAVDLHFHGAFGIDLMTASAAEMDRLSEELWKQGVAGFCPTTLSSPSLELKDAVRRIGQWIRSGTAPGAKPLGIHLEGPFISPHACGAHPLGSLRSLSFSELEELWEVSAQSLKILTLAPETLADDDLKKLCARAKKRRIRLSLGHSKCTEHQARMAFEAGFSGVTHAWNALSTHHRDPGALGAAFGRKNLAIELIIDQVHVSPTVIQWTLDLHPKGVVFVSDAAPAAGMADDRFVRFGALKCRLIQGAARTENGALAGGGILLPEAFSRWLNTQSSLTGEKSAKLWRTQVDFLTRAPLRAIFIDEKVLKKRRVRWKISPHGEISVQPISSVS